MSTITALPAPSARAVADGRFEWATYVTGWLLMITAISQLILRSGLWIYHGHVVPATVLTLITVAFLFLLRPRLGSFHELPAVISAFVIFLTTLIGLTHVLANEGDWPLARLYQSLQGQVISLVGSVTGEGIATFGTSPLYLLCAFVLVLSFAYQSYAGFILFMSLPLIHGLYPWNLSILTAYLLWFAGFLLITRETVYLPRTVEERLPLRPALRELLLEARERPLTEREVLFYLGGDQDDEAHQAQTTREILALADAGLLEYSRDTGKVYATKVLEQSYLPPAIAHVIALLSTLASGVVLLLAGAYLLMPIDLLPEALVGPIGFLDDLVILGLGSLPLGARVLEMAKGVLGRRGTR
jgi:hypothetical protein